MFINKYATDQLNDRMVTRIVELYQTKTIAEVHTHMQQEFPNKTVSLARISEIIKKKRASLAQEALQATKEGDLARADQLNAKMKDELLDKRSRLSRAIEKYFEETIADF